MGTTQSRARTPPPPALILPRSFLTETLKKNSLFLRPGCLYKEVIYLDLKLNFKNIRSTYICVCIVDMDIMYNIIGLYMSV